MGKEPMPKKDPKKALAVGKKLSEDTFVPGGKEVAPQKSQAERLYPKTAATA